MCTQESWLRILAISNRYLFKPASINVSRNRGSWVMGVQAATTTRLRLCSSMIRVMLTWVSWEQVNRLSSTYATLGSVLEYSDSAGTSTMPPMLMPQLQTNTPMRGASSALMSLGVGACRVLVSVQRTSPKEALTAPAAADACMTDSGMSLGPCMAPQT